MNIPDSQQAISKTQLIFPGPKTLSYKCICLLLNGKILSHPAFEKVTGSWRLAAVVYILKKLGWPVQSFKRHAATVELPDRYISYYYLPANIIIKVLGSASYDK